MGVLKLTVKLIFHYINGIGVLRFQIIEISDRLNETLFPITIFPLTLLTIIKHTL